MYPRLVAFKKRIGPNPPPLCFAKVDVQSAFHTIPQAAIVALMKDILRMGRYKIVKFAQVQAPEHARKATSRWHSLARPSDDDQPFHQLVGDALGAKVKNAIFFDSVLQRR